ncbi:LysR family transcriptional regulator [Marinomonas mediterranea]|uniref:LysR substrate-binding domain-containing protein n=1 Tax=Marinomonas mediterranea TaxID=119864 RepID=UPI00234B5145|nr:LysR family transcriptional regulator [Marinomonas mediterranea]WCN08574.1 LysR family transcriptional regulator [Marinomonas mediterranea]WCN12628.1 LysR family transcriptional regulator [Marinomonas mediterranea]
MDISQLKSFVTVARESSVRRAAEHLCLSQPAISAHLKTIEEITGLPLFERASTGMILTPQGTELLPKAQHALSAYSNFLEEAKSLKNRVSETLTIGIAPSTSSHVLGQLISKLADCYPNMRVEAKRFPAHEIRPGLRNGFFDVAFYNEYGTPLPEQLVQLVDQFSVSLASPKGMLNEEQTNDWTYLATLPWILPANNTCCSKLAEQLFKELNFIPDNLIRVDDEKVVMTLISQGVGIGLIHDKLNNHPEFNGLFECIYTVNQAVPVYFTCLQTRRSEPAIQAALEIIMDYHISQR